MTEKTLREELESAFNADDRKIKEDAERRIDSRSKGWEAARSALMKAKDKK